MAAPPEALSDSADSVAKAEKRFGKLRIVLLLVVLGLGGLGWLVGGWIGMLPGLGIGVVLALGVVLVAGLFFAMSQDNR